MRRLALLIGLLAVAGCGARDDRPTLVIQRFFGECGAVYGHALDVGRAETECGILTTMINRFVADNPGIRVKVNIVAWPGYPQLTAQIAAGDPPDLVIMHQSALADYQGRGLLMPMEPVLRAAGLRLADFTDAGQRGVVKDGHVYAMPFDTIGGLFHINTALMAKAGLMRGGRPVLPGSPAELIAQARQFRAATGKPYLIQAQLNDPATHVRNLYTYLLAEDAVIFPDARHVRLNTPAAREIVGLLKALNTEGLSTRNQDFPAASQSFTNGEGGIFPVGTWMIGPYDQEAREAGRPLYHAYAVLPYPRLWGARGRVRRRPCLGDATPRTLARTAGGGRAVPAVPGGAQRGLDPHRPPARDARGARPPELPRAAAPRRHRRHGRDRRPAAGLCRAAVRHPGPDRRGAGVRGRRQQAGPGRAERRGRPRERASRPGSRTRPLTG